MIGLLLLIWFLVGFVHMLYCLYQIVTTDKQLIIKDVVELFLTVLLGVGGLVLHFSFYLIENSHKVIWRKKVICGKIDNDSK